MIQVLVEKIGNVLEKDFLFGSFLPALLFVGAIVVSGAGVVGFEASLTWAAQRGPLDKVLYPAAAAILITVFAYALNALRPLMLRVWSGQAYPRWFWPVADVAKDAQLREFLRQRDESEQPNRWEDLPEWLATEAEKSWDVATVDADDVKRLQLLAALDIQPSDTNDELKAKINKHLLQQLLVYSGESLSPVYEKVNRQLSEWREAEAVRLQIIRLHLDRSYGPLYCIRPTRLGNIIESYTDYSYTRYRIQPKAFWPHLQQHIGESLRAQLAEARTMLFFALSLGTLAILYGMLCLFAGPHCWLSYVWWILPAVSFGVAWVGYRVSIIAAEQFGDAFRACFDVHRLALLRALHRRTPPSLQVERERWKEMSQLVMYGETTDIDITPDAQVTP